MTLTPEQLEARREWIGASDIAAILLPVLKLTCQLFRGPGTTANLKRDNPVFRAGRGQQGLALALHQSGNIRVFAPVCQGDFDQFQRQFRRHPASVIMVPGTDPVGHLLPHADQT